MKSLKALLLTMICGISFIQPAWASWEERVVVLPLSGGNGQAETELFKISLQDSAINILKAVIPDPTLSTGALNRRYIYRELETLMTQTSSLPDQAQFKAFANKLNADFIFTGETKFQATQVTVAVYAFNAKANTLTQIGSIQGQKTDLPDLHRQFIQLILEALALNLNEAQKKELAFYANPPLKPAHYKNYLQGILALDKQDYKTAILKLTQAIESNPNYAWPMTQRGVAYLQSGNYEKAYQDFEKACDMGESDACAWKNV